MSIVLRIPIIKSRTSRILDFTKTGTRSTSLTLGILIINPTINFTGRILRILDFIKRGKITIDIIIIDFRNKIIIILYNY